jgi:hypothetical protein
MPTHDEEHGAEAERLRLLPRADQRAFVAMLRADARNPAVPIADRDFARRRALALERLLRLRPRRKES